MISGAFSLTQQAILLGLLPRMRITHTSAREGGQILGETAYASVTEAALRLSPPGVHVLPPELLRAAARGPARDVLTAAWQ